MEPSVETLFYRSQELRIGWNAHVKRYSDCCLAEDYLCSRSISEDINRMERGS